MGLFILRHVSLFPLQCTRKSPVTARAGLYWACLPCPNWTQETTSVRPRTSWEPLRRLSPWSSRSPRRPRNAVGAQGRGGQGRARGRSLWGGRDDRWVNPGRCCCSRRQDFPFSDLPGKDPCLTGPSLWPGWGALEGRDSHSSLLTPLFGLDSGSAHGRTGGSPGTCSPCVNPFLCSGLLGPFGAARGAASP